MAASYDDQPQDSLHPHSDSRLPSRPNSSSSRKSPDDPDLPSPRSGGCWTCRLRRKKCDEVNREGSCETCLRLKITCLGWSNKKPEWMKNKEEVELYKAQIKQQLIRSGRIRGQPRARIAAAGPVLPVVPTIPTIPVSTASNTQYSSTAQSRSDYLSDEHLSPQDLAGDSSSSSTSPMIPLVPVQPNPEDLGAHSYSTLPPSQLGFSVPGNSNSSMSNFMSAPTNATHNASSNLVFNPMRNPYTVSLNETSDFNAPLHSQPQHQLWQSSPTSTASSQQEILIFYYFEKVLPYQFPFSDSIMVTALQEATVSQPDGPLAHSVCAIAALYAVRTGQGADFGIDTGLATRCNDFFQWSYLHLAEKGKLQQPYTEADALAAVQLLCYFSLSGATGDWGLLLKVGYDWLGNSSILSQQNPLAFVQNSTDVTKLAYRAVLWMDVFGSITLRTAPRFSRLHQNLLQPGASYYAAPNVPNSAAFPSLHMEALMGCPDDVMLALAQTSELRFWKDQQRLNGCLSVQTLVERARGIESLLRRLRTSPSLSRTSSGNRGDPSRRGSSASVLSGHPSSSTASPGSVESVTLFPRSPGESSALVADLFRLGALLLLSTVVNEHFPQVPEIRELVQSIITTLERLPVAASERVLTLPIFLAGCLTDDTLERQFFSNRFAMQSQAIGVVPQCMKLMETVWERRSVQGGGIDWHPLMTEQGISILFV